MLLDADATLAACAEIIAEERSARFTVERRLDAMQAQLERLSSQGPAGPAGERGPPGERGQTGDRGERGIDGTHGQPGPAGPAGERGEIGAAGTQGEPGAPGADGRGWRSAGFYEATRGYSEGDVVALDGGSFVAAKDDPGPCPGEGWSQIVRRGKPGPKGDRGETGMPGAPAPRLLTLKALPGYMAQPIFEDGSEGQPFTVRAWFEYHEGLG